MKKITLLFAAMLAMFGDAFGQKEGKVLWENMVDTITAGAFVNNLANNPIASPSGNVFVQFNYILNNNIRKSGAKLYDKNGKIIWDAKDFYQNATTGFSANVQSKNYTLLYKSYSSSRNGSNTIYDSTLFLGKDFNLLRKFELQKSSSNLVPVDDGVFYYENDKSLVKYNSEGKEEWRYDSANPIFIINRKAPYICSEYISSISRIVFFTIDKNGKKKFSIEPQISGIVFPTNDKGFWLIDHDDVYIKFDSTGKKTAENSEFKLLYNQFIARRTVLPDNSLLIDVMRDNGISLIKISPSGVVKEDLIPALVKFKDRFSTFFFKAVASENKIMYSLRLPDSEQAEADIKYKIGVVDFDNSVNSWSRDVLGGASNGINGNAFTFEAGNTFFQAYSDPNQPLLKTFRTYDVTGNLIWKSSHGTGSPQGSPLNWKIIDDALYFSGVLMDSLSYGKYEMLKVRITDGKTLWKKSSKPTIYLSNGVSYVSNGSTSFNTISESIKKDKDGNDVIFYNEPSSTSFGEFKIGFLNPDGTNKWTYTLPNYQERNSQVGNKTNFTPTDDGKLIVLSQETKDNKQQYILRKISPCGDLNAIAITANKTEACPTEKVKLSIPKQDGITYQWQKDGKDILNTKDVVYDFGESGIYTVLAKDELCQNTVTSNALKINIRSLPNTEITAPKSTFCDGEKTTIASRTNGTFFQWQKDGKDIPNATSGILEVSQAGDYRVGVRDDKCPQVGYSNIYTIITKLLPESSISTDIKGVVYEPFTVKMTANSGTGLAYQWLKDGAEIPNETKATYEAQKSGKYNVNVTYDGCTKLSDALTISILIPLSNQEEIGEEEVKVYPNPSKGEFKIILPKSLKSADIQLFDTFGRERLLVYVGEQAQADGLTQGVYFLRVRKGEKVVTSKLIIE